jgi:SEC-C motif-containing protein
MATLCPCGSGRDYDACCGALHRGKRRAETPLELMKSRYSAYAVGNGRYLVETTASENRHEGDAALIEEHARHTEWLKLEIVDSTESGDEGMVEFKAFYRENGVVRVLHEKSRFLRREGMWYYIDGILYDTKIGRNDPCPCGSGKKFKKCCG